MLCFRRGIICRFASSKCDLALRKSQGKLRRSPQLVSLWRTLGSNDRQKVRLFVPLRSLVKLTRNLTRSRVKPQPKIYALLSTRDNLPFCLQQMRPCPPQVARQIKALAPTCISLANARFKRPSESEALCTASLFGETDEEFNPFPSQASAINLHYASDEQST